MNQRGVRPGGWRSLGAVGVAAGAALVLVTHAAGPLFALALGGAVFLAARALYPRLRRAAHIERHRRDEVRERADQQHRWELRGDIRGRYGAAASDVVRPLTPPVKPPGAGARVAEVVHTDTELQALLRDRPPSWRYAVFVSVLVQRRAAVQARLRDARLGFAHPTGETLTSESVVAHCFSDRLADLSELIERIDSFMLSPAFQEVFGDPHDEHSADAVGIVHAAHRLMDYHDQLIALAERVRGVAVPASCSDLQHDFGLLAVLPLDGFHDFIEDFTKRVAEMADVVRYSPGDVQLDPVELGVNGGDDLIERVSRRLRQLMRGDATQAG